MPKGRIIVIMGSRKDYTFASRIKKFLQEESFDVDCNFVVASAHRTPRRLLETVEKWEKTEEHLVFVTVAGLSDALSGVVAGCTKYPVVACPPDLKEYGWAKFFSSAVTPLGITVAYVPRPENAVLSAIKMLAISDKALQKEVENYMETMRKSSADSRETFRG